MYVFALILLLAISFLAWYCLLRCLDDAAFRSSLKKDRSIDLYERKSLLAYRLLQNRFEQENRKEKVGKGARKRRHYKRIVRPRRMRRPPTNLGPSTSLAYRIMIPLLLLTFFLIFCRSILL